MDQSPPSLSSSVSLVSRAKTALHSAAAKAEKVLIDIKADLKIDRESEGQIQMGPRRSTDREIDVSDDFGRSRHEAENGEVKAVLLKQSLHFEVIERSSSKNEGGSYSPKKLTTPPASVTKQLASAIENAKNFKSVYDLLTSSVDPSTTKKNSGFSFSVMKSLVIQEKEDKDTDECSFLKVWKNVKNFKSVNDLLTLSVDPSSTKEKSGLSFSVMKSLVIREKEDMEINSSILLLFKSEEQVLPCKWDSGTEVIPVTRLLKDLHGAPPESFIVQLSIIIGGFKSLQKMASFWCSVIVELRKLWFDGQPIPRMPLDADPDLNSCLLHQQLQVINCSIARKQRRSIAEESLHSVLEKANHDLTDSSLDCKVYARTSTGDYVLRLGAVRPSETLRLLETDEPVYSPITQEGPVITEEFIKETEEFVLRTGSVGPGCSQLLSDMQAFKAANPGCILEDFIRWHSPPDWRKADSNNQYTDSVDEEGSSRRGRLSKRMQEEGNLWRELWETAKALPAVKQAPLFDEDLAVEGILTSLENIQPSELFEQLFISAICAGLLIVESTLPEDSNLTKLYNECKIYIISSYQSGISGEKLDDICKVYGTIEAMVLKPEEVSRAIEQPDETATGDSKKRFKIPNLNFVGKDKQALWKRTPKDGKKSEAKQGHVLSNLFDKRTSLFSKRPAKSGEPSPTSAAMDDGEWTIV